MDAQAKVHADAVADAAMDAQAWMQAEAVADEAVGAQARVHAEAVAGAHGRADEVASGGSGGRGGGSAGQCAAGRACGGSGGGGRASKGAHGGGGGSARARRRSCTRMRWRWAHMRKRGGGGGEGAGRTQSADAANLCPKILSGRGDGSSHVQEDMTACCLLPHASYSTARMGRTGEALSTMLEVAGQSRQDSKLVAHLWSPIYTSFSVYWSTLQSCRCALELLYHLLLAATATMT